jgi:acyl dehydratase
VTRSEEAAVAVVVGHRFPEREFYVDPVRVEEFVLALGVDPAPGYRAEPGAPIPPGFLMYVTTYGADPIHAALDLDLLRTVFGGTDEEFLAPVRVGDRLTVRPEITNIVEKTGGSGRLTFVEITTEYVRDDGAVAVRERSTVVQRG